MPKNVDISNGVVGNNLQQFRRASGMSRDELAQAAGVTYKTVLDIELNRRRCVQEKTLQSLSKALSCSYDELLKAGIDKSRSHRHSVWWSLGMGLFFLLLVAVALYWRHSEPQTNPVSFENVLTLASGGQKNTWLNDLDGDGMPECIQISESRDRHMIVWKFDPSNPKKWRVMPLFQHPYREIKESFEYAFDIDNDGTKELFIACKDSSSTWIDVRNIRGDLIKSIEGASGRFKRSPFGYWGGIQYVKSVWTYPRSEDVHMLIQTVTPYERYPRDFREVSFENGETTWLFPIGAYPEEIYAVDLDNDGAMEFCATGASTNNGADQNGFDDDHAYAFVLESDGTLKWKRTLGGLFTLVRSMMLVNDNEKTAQWLIKINRRDVENPKSPCLYLLDANSGAILDSISYSGSFCGNPIAKQAGEGWEVYWGTTTGSLRCYRIQNKTIKLASDIKIAESILQAADKLIKYDSKGFVPAICDGFVYLIDCNNKKVVGIRELPRNIAFSELAVLSSAQNAGYLAAYGSSGYLFVDRVEVNDDY